MADSEDVPMGVLNLDFLLFVVQQASIDTGVDAHLAGIDHTAQLCLEEGAFGAFGKELSSGRVLVLDELAVAQRGSEDPAIGKRPPPNLQGRKAFELQVAPVLCDSRAADVLDFVVAS